jgi:hypothetical protein
VHLRVDSSGSYMTLWRAAVYTVVKLLLYRGADKSIARTTSRCILLDSENISFDASLVIYLNNNNVPQIMIINRIYENHNLLSL